MRLPHLALDHVDEAAVGEHRVGPEHVEEVGEVGHGDAQEGAGLGGELLPEHLAAPGEGEGGNEEMVHLPVVGKEQMLPSMSKPVA